MRNSVLATVILMAFAAASCKKNSTAILETIPQQTLDKISQLGFSTANVQKVDEGYLVENDIIISDANLMEVPRLTTLRIAQTEQYRTYNLVTGTPRVITVSSSPVSSNLSTAIDNAIARYNALNLGLTFQRVASGGAINVKTVKHASYIASAGFPTSSGSPYSQVTFNIQYQNWGNSTLSTVIAHEMGHCIGFRHTDYMDRSFSCGGNPVNEGSGSVGAVWIPGTPTGPDDGSWMLACIDNGIDRPFNSNDAVALHYLY